jgi:hypothetical protein
VLERLLLTLLAALELRGQRPLSLLAFLELCSHRPLSLRAPVELRLRFRRPFSLLAALELRGRRPLLLLPALELRLRDRCPLSLLIIARLIWCRLGRHRLLLLALLFCSRHALGNNALNGGFQRLRVAVACDHSFDGCAQETISDHTSLTTTLTLSPQGTLVAQEAVEYS